MIEEATKSEMSFLKRTKSDIATREVRKIEKQHLNQ
jgi:hypothetical protein